MKKLTGILAIAVLCSSLFAAGPAVTFNSKAAITDTGSKKFNAIGAKQTVIEMKTGWNLGNTMDANPGQGFQTISSETCWGQPKTTKAMIDALAAAGFKTIRIPTSWSNHLKDDKYTIDPDWMARVKEIVDWAIEDDMYVILNCHHDNADKNIPHSYGEGYYPTKANYDESAKFLVNIWSQICLAFNKGYDEHLIFETLNEPRLRSTNQEWYFNKNDALSRESAEVLNQFNQLILDTIRKSGGNNAKRCVMVPGLAAAPNAALADEFVLPKDKAPDQLMVSVHMYSPYHFAMQSPGSTEFTPRAQNELAAEFISLDKKFTSKGIPVVVGEYGATNKNNLEARVNWFEYFNSFARSKGMVCVLWDNGAARVTKKGDYNEKYGYFNRRALTWYFPEIVEAINRGCEPKQE